MTERPYVQPIPYHDPIEAFQPFAADPAAEYDEAMNKIRPLLQSLDPGDARQEQAQ